MLPSSSSPPPSSSFWSSAAAVSRWRTRSSVLSTRWLDMSKGNMRTRQTHHISTASWITLPQICVRYLCLLSLCLPIPICLSVGLRDFFCIFVNCLLYFSASAAVKASSSPSIGGITDEEKRGSASRIKRYGYGGYVVLCMPHIL